MTVPPEGVDLIGQEMVDLGSEGIIIEERRLDTFIPPDPEESSGEDLRIRIFFPDQPRDALCRRILERLRQLAHLVPGLVPSLPEVSTMRQEDWAEGWKQHFPVIRLGRLIIQPSWEEAPRQKEDAVLRIDPGMAFGTGTHATTRLCLEEIVSLFDSPDPPRKVLDVGTGSGILALAAAVLGAPRVLGTDIDEEACRAAQENARRNGMEERVEIRVSPLEELERDYDLVLANILAEELARISRDLAERLGPGGILVLSGVLKEKESLIEEVFSLLPVTGLGIRRNGEWSCIVYRRRSE